jgi:hypothetical protein
MKGKWGREIRKSNGRVNVMHILYACMEIK